MKRLILLLILPLLFACKQEFFVNCNTENYFISPNKNLNTGFLNQQREVVTMFSEKELESSFNETNISCKDVLSNFFYCNICFNNDANYLISYSGKRFDLDTVDDPNTFTNNLIDLISSMQMGSEEYDYFLKNN